ncbi:MAG: hypothetical protein IJT80_03280 [Lachnospiraceae bacterium]|nr:hypothetical protein [Lachnospiraceae bacterium]MCR5406070.1 hypothetical protein [Lachnospiraceae bacterium]
MSVNGIQGYSQIDAYSAYNSAKKISKQEKTEETSSSSASNKAAETGVIYEKSADAAKELDRSGVIYKPNTALVEQLKADQDANKQRLMDMVHDTLSGQFSAFKAANGDDEDSIWRFLASGKFTVSAAAKEEAQKAISEDGFYGVKNTSDRILEMAKALTGGDPGKIEEMRDAFKKGFDQATKSWGQALPEISSKTYDAVMEGFDNWANESQTKVEG